MPETPFYKDHWVTIEAERLERYQRMFEWNPDSAALYESAEIGPGQVVAELGCGPGHTAIEIARWVGPRGRVHGFDINAEFIAQAQANAAKAGLAERLSVQQSDGVRLPLEDGKLDRISARNTLIYVDDPQATIAEFHRVLRPGGRMHAIEGDWPMMVVEPIPTDIWQRLVAAASRASRTPEIGRKLTGLLARAGFTEVEVQVITRADRSGRLLPMMRTISDYARDSGEMAAAEIDQILAAMEEGVSDGTYLALAPQFVVTGVR